MTEFGFEPIYGSLLVALFAAIAIIVVIVFFAPQTVEPRHRRMLIVLRSVAALTILLAAFRPSLIRTDKKPADATLVVAVDLSRSMTLPDTENNDRWTTQLKTWKALSKGLTRFDETLSIQLIGYDNEAQVINSVEPTALDTINPEGDSTNLGNATTFALKTAGSSPLAGIVFIGDGRHTARISKPGQPAENTNGAQRSVETLNSLGVPFWAIPIGPAAGTSSNRDAAVDALQESFQLFAGNEFDVSYQVVARGLAGVDLPIKLTWIKEDGKRMPAAERLIVPEKSDETNGMTVSLTAPEPGAYRLEVEAVKRSGELVTQNNIQTAFVEIREGGGRILYLEGTPRPEQSFLRQALRRFPDLDLRYKWLRQDVQWPVNLDDRFKPGKFDVYIIGDLDASALGKQQLEDLSEAVGAGAGLITLGGFQTYGRGGYAKTALANVLPIKMDSSRRRAVSSDREPNDPSQLPGPISLKLKRNHPITDLGGDDPASIWKTLPPMPGANKLLETKVAPGVQVLLETQNGDLMMVAGEYGRGRVASLAFDSTWRWWRAGQNEVHRRFWRQTLLWLLSREETGGDRILLQLDSRRFPVQSPPEFHASIESIASPTTKRTLVAEIVASDGTTTPVPVSTANSDENVATAKGRIPKLETGFYRLRVSTKDDSDVEPAERAFQVLDESRELSQPMADPVYLRQLANITSSHGGAAYSADQVDELIETIGQRRRQAETPVVEKLRLGDGPVTGWILFLVFAAALSGEWYLRRQIGLA